MERLTKYICDRAHGAEGVSAENLTGSYFRGAFEATAIVERLAEIEDILGDEYNLDRLQELAEADRDGRYIIMKYPEQDGVKRLRELAEADRDGRCVVLPCKVGDVLYSAFPLCGVNKHQVRKFERNSEGDFACSALMIPLSDFGKRVFLTREEAEAALKGEQDG